MVSIKKTLIGTALGATLIFGAVGSAFAAQPAVDKAAKRVELKQQAKAQGMTVKELKAELKKQKEEQKQLKAAQKEQRKKAHEAKLAEKEKRKQAQEAKLAQKAQKLGITVEELKAKLKAKKAAKK
ncbi:hypothetical protein RCG23_13215 [Neobacillus sp. PS3-34]|uniref:hypothetical protein n=1 Tax=Neobacillus sp. PS3-34 TaxID=3070678 RepID=UPI0027E18B84|nr:hypothetical protein [Neobacillus sp. PS3-34]WML46615.1 hypothetical protein RCG23_13215 [Neobacillus sp. PS3-34]